MDNIYFWKPNKDLQHTINYLEPINIPVFHHVINDRSTGRKMFFVHDDHNCPICKPSEISKNLKCKKVFFMRTINTEGKTGFIQVSKWKFLKLRYKAVLIHKIKLFWNKITGIFK